MKLVSEAGVGTIAAGVAKAGAQVVLISGYDGGTGAAPESSIHNAGLPWELGLAEAHQTLMRNSLRSRVVLETDGKLMSGFDVAVAALLGAEEFGFATAPLVSLGCVMMRVCNLDTCPVGIATQNPELRKRFCGKPEYVINFMKYVAQELREIMARLGVRTVDEMVGRGDLLRVKDHQITDRAASIDLRAILSSPIDGDRHFKKESLYDFHLEDTLDVRFLLKKLDGALKDGKRKTIDVKVSSTNRTLGTILGSEITKRYRNTLKNDTYTIRCTGGGGQSFGAFIPKGLTMILEGDCNDHLGKGLSGGKLIVYPSKGSSFKAEENVIVGNVALYGATSGEAYINGKAGERFCVRNSGACAVVEGVGDHGCEYMTGGRVVVLGTTGKNFAAGMSGGIAYVLDRNHDLYMRVNKSMITLSEVKEKHYADELKSIIQAHVKYTASQFAKEVLEHFDEYLPQFKMVIPNDYIRMTEAIGRLEEKGMSRQQAEIEAFYINKNAQGRMK